jgi:hypothetical protein
MPIPRPPEVRFWKHVTKTRGCWLWSNATDNYGHIYIDNQSVKAHRFSYELHYGPVPEGMYVLHKCDNKRCVNSKHLYAGTPSANIRDWWNRQNGGKKS